MAELLALADDEARGLWDGLRLGYTESSGHPLLRAEIAGLYERIGPDDVLVFSGAEEAIFCLLNVALGPGDHAIVDLAGLPEPVRGRPGGRCRGQPPRAPGSRTAGRSTLDRIRAALRPDDPPGRRQCAAQPDRDAAEPRGVAGADRPVRRGRRDPLLRRGLSVPRVRPGRPAAGRGRCRARRSQPGGDVEVVRNGRPADRLAGQPTTTTSSRAVPRSRTTPRSVRPPRPRS